MPTLQLESIPDDVVAALRVRLAAAGYGPAGIAACLGVDDLEALPLLSFPIGMLRLPDEPPVFLATKAFFLCDAVPADALGAMLGLDVCEALERADVLCRAAEDDARLRSAVALWPAGEGLLVTAPLRETAGGGGARAPEAGASDPPGLASRLLEALIPRRPARRALALDAGSGLGALSCARWCSDVVAACETPGARAALALSVRLAGAGNVLAVSAEPPASFAARGPFDLVLAEPPAGAAPGRAPREDATLLLGPSGAAAETIAALPALLAPEGQALIATFLPRGSEEKLRERLASLLGPEPFLVTCHVASVVKAYQIAHGRALSQIVKGDGPSYEAALHLFLKQCAASGIYELEVAVLSFARGPRSLFDRRELRHLPF